MKRFVKDASTIPVLVSTEGSSVDVPALVARGLTVATGDEVYAVPYGREFLIVAVVSR